MVRAWDDGSRDKRSSGGYMSELVVSIKAEDLSVINSIFGTTTPALGASVKTDSGLGVLYKNHIVRRGMLDSHTTMELVLTLTADVSTHLAAMWLAGIFEKAILVRIGTENVNPA